MRKSRAATARHESVCPICGGFAAPRGTTSSDPPKSGGRSSPASSGGSAAGNPAFPFCSPQCKLVDLGRWLDGAYRIPGPPVDPEDPEDK
jgi:endogenous inhibitor of DNA gyrase (YacG/DUF329 family)